MLKEHDRRTPGPCNWLSNDDLASSRGKERPPCKVTAERQIEDPNRTLKPTLRGHYLPFGRFECG